MISHLPRCTKLTDPTRYACNCGADAQNELAAKLDAAELPETLTPSDEAAILAFRAGQAVTRDLLATDAGPAADASLEARAVQACDVLAAELLPAELPPHCWLRVAWFAVVRAVDASRPGLTEEQIETLIFALRQRPPFDGDGDLLRALRAMKHDARRASRGETARAADTLGPGIGGEPIKIRPTTTKDPSR